MENAISAACKARLTSLFFSEECFSVTTGTRAQAPARLPHAGLARLALRLSAGHSGEKAPSIETTTELSFGPPTRTPNPTLPTCLKFGRRAISLAPVSYPTAGHTLWPSTQPFSVDPPRFDKKIPPSGKTPTPKPWRQGHYTLPPHAQRVALVLLPLPKLRRRSVVPTTSFDLATTIPTSAMKPAFQRSAARSIWPRNKAATLFRVGSP